MTIASNMVDTVRALVQDGSTLVRQEIQLAKAEMSEKMEEATHGILAIVAGAIFALVALFILAQALTVALANFMPPSLAALIVGIVLAICAWFAISSGTSRLSADNLRPDRTIRSVRESAETVQEAA